MQRRKFIKLVSGAAVAWPSATRAQQPERVRRIGVLMPGSADDAELKVRIAAFQHGLRELGWTDGRNVRFDYRWGMGDADRIRSYAAELATLAPDVIMADGSAAVGALVRAAPSVPIVFATIADPVGGGYVDSLARPAEM
jgi:putative tryptophan/tyrosine transport system substrate-binding protein